jgi:hypothetical protein
VIVETRLIASLLLGTHSCATNYVIAINESHLVAVAFRQRKEEVF